MSRDNHVTTREEPHQPRRFNLTDREYEQIRRLVKENTGINLGMNKRDLVISRLSRRLRNLGLDSFSQYIQLLRDSEATDELINMINQITTNKTEFFREKHHFDYLSEELLPRLRQEGEKSGNRKLRIWSAGCSSGEEPYTIALVLTEFFAQSRGWDLKILATDLDTNILQRAMQGAYTQESVRPVPPALLGRYFDRQLQDDKEYYVVKANLRQLITFRKFNLMTPSYPLQPILDIVFCRNVLIYFDNDDKLGILTKFHKLLKPGGHLFVGHSESLMMIKHLFSRRVNTIHQKI
jgi:chemotaxis protein methyltransferase CheR